MTTCGSTAPLTATTPILKRRTLLIGGWHDAYSNTVPRMLARLACPRQGIVGPWAHRYPHFATPGPRIGFLQIAVRWWDHWLKGVDNGGMAEPRYRAYLMDGVAPQPRLTGSGPGAGWPSINGRANGSKRRGFFLMPAGSAARPVKPRSFKSTPPKTPAPTAASSALCGLARTGPPTNATTTPAPWCSTLRWRTAR